MPFIQGAAAKSGAAENSGHSMLTGTHASRTSRREAGASSPAANASLPLTTLVTPSCGYAEGLVTHALEQTRVDILRTSPSLSCVDPRVVVDIAVMDLKAMGAEGQLTLDNIRSRWPTAFVICLNVANDGEAASALERGADCAHCHDASPAFLCSVVRAAARRLNYLNAELRLSFGDLVFDRETRGVWCASQPVALTGRESKLFEHLFLNAGQIVTPHALTACAWRVDPTIKSNGLAVYVGYLRRKLRRSVLTTLVTMRGQGYGLVLRSDNQHLAHSGRRSS